MFQLLFFLATQKNNSRCADCCGLCADWASVSHGSFVCLNCAGRHRELGLHVRFTRSLLMDQWTGTGYSASHLTILPSGGYFRTKMAPDKKCRALQSLSFSRAELCQLACLCGMYCPWWTDWLSAVDWLSVWTTTTAYPCNHVIGADSHVFEVGLDNHW